ncbi:MAG: hypothetical protein JW789_00285 [Candidatus Aenigmarchaeota archaeon]|nr:hypothetical protein [Candidatus Aenigmarchaeota archaeon]
MPDLTPDPISHHVSEMSGYFNFLYQDVDMIFTCKKCGAEFFTSSTAKICPDCRKTNNSSDSQGPPWGFG